MKTTRRHLLKQGVSAALYLTTSGAPRTLRRAAAGESDPAPDTVPSPPIVDTHQHLWDLERLRLPWVRSSEKLYRSFLTKDYLEATRGLHVVRAVYMEVAVEAEQLVEEADYAIALCEDARSPTCAAVIGGRPASPDFGEYLARFRGSKHVKGVRQVLFSDPDLCRKDDFVRGIRLLGELGMSFDLCVSPQALGNGVRLVEQCPATRFVVDHCGNADPKAFRERGKVAGKDTAPPSHDPDDWRRDMERLARRKNTVCKISGIVAGAPEGWSPDDLAPPIRHCLDVFGPDRVVFGSDWPVCTRAATLREWVEALRKIVAPLDETRQRKLFHDNAVAFYGLA